MLSELGEFRPGKRRQSDGIKSDSGSHQHESWMDGNVGRSCWDTYTRNTRCLVGNDGNLESGGKCQCGNESCRMIEGQVAGSLWNSKNVHQVKLGYRARATPKGKCLFQ